jgi:sugar lactone lactonase YvrE
MKTGCASTVFLFLGTAAVAQTQEYVISTFAGGAPPQTPVLGVSMPIGPVQAVATDTAGNTYFVSFRCVFKLDPNGVVTRIAGNARAGYSGDRGPAINAQLRLDSIALTFGLPVGGRALGPGIAADNSGNVYVADNGNFRVRRISRDGTISTVAGDGTPGFSGDGGPATSAQLSAIFGLALDAAGNLWIADSGANRIRRITPYGDIATVVGTGNCGFSGDGGPALTAQICGPTGIAADSAGNLLIIDSGNNAVRKLSPDETITTVSGNGPITGIGGSGCLPSGDGGPASWAGLCLPSNVAVDQAGNVFVADTYFPFEAWQVVRKISPGNISTVAGFDCSTGDTNLALLSTAAFCASVLANGTTATTTYLIGPVGLAVDHTGNLLVADPVSQRIRKVSADGTITTIAGAPPTLSPYEPLGNDFAASDDGGLATSAQLASPKGVAIDASGNVFISDSLNDCIRKVSPVGITTTVVGNGTFGSTGDGGPARSAQIAPVRVTVDRSGALFLFDYPDRSIRRVSPDEIISTVTVVGGNDYYVAVDSADDLFIADPKDTSGAIAEVSPDGTISRVAGGVAGNGTSGFSSDGGPATSPQLSEVNGVAVDGAGNLFVADSRNHRVRRVTPDGIITTIAGNGTQGFSGDGGPAIDAQLAFPIDVAVDAAGNLFIADFYNNRIRRVSADGIITTIAGNGTQGYSGDDGPASSASLSTPWAVALDGVGNVYVADTGNNAIRVLRPAKEPLHRRRGRP